jgi:hypothetical protein
MHIYFFISKPERKRLSRRYGTGLEGNSKEDPRRTGITWLTLWKVFGLSYTQCGTISSYLLETANGVLFGGNITTHTKHTNTAITQYTYCIHTNTHITQKHH